MKTELKEIILMGLGALSLTDEKAEELKQKLLKKGEKLYNEGLVKNEELKRNIQEKIKENTNIQVTPVSKEIIVEYINSIDDKEKEEIITLLNQDEKSYEAESESKDKSKEEKGEEKNENEEK